MTELSFQLYSARNVPSLPDFLATLGSLGYTQVEGYGGLYDDAEEDGRKAFEAAGVEIVSIDGAAIEPFKKLADVPTEEQIVALEAKGLKARALLAKARGMVAQA